MAKTNQRLSEKIMADAEKLENEMKARTAAHSVAHHEGPKSELMVQSVQLSDIDRLASAEPAPIDLMSDYWTPEIPGELKRVLFDRIDVSPVLAQDTGEVIDLECAFFFYKQDNIVKQIRNGSKRLVGALTAYNIKRGAALEIKFLGKKKNRTNQFMSDNWSIKPLVLQVKAN